MNVYESQKSRKKERKKADNMDFPTLILFLICKIKDKEIPKKVLILFTLFSYIPWSKNLLRICLLIFFWSAVIILEYFPNFHLLYHHRRTRIDILYVKQHVLIQNRLSFSFAMGPRSLGPKHK